MEIPWMAHVTSSSFLLPVIAGIARFKRLSIAMKIFLLFCFSTCTEIAGEYVLSWKHINNSFLSNYDSLLESAFIFTVYFLSIKNIRTKQIISALAVFFLFVWIIDKMYFEIPDQLNDKMAIASRIFIILVSVMTIHAIVQQTNHPLTDEPVFWASGGAVIYSTGVLFIVGLSNELLKMGISYFTAAWYFNWTLAIISNVIFTKGFFTTAKHQI
jgi:hypothetical protein